MNMNIILIILAVIASPFLLAFILGAVKASKAGSDKIRRARALISLSQMTEEQRIALKDIFIAYKAKDIEKVNEVSEKVSPEIINFLIDFFDYDNRPVEYSSGKTGRMIWEGFKDKLKKWVTQKLYLKLFLVSLWITITRYLKKRLTYRRRKIKHKFFLIFLAIFILLGWFYWFQLRPSLTRSQCLKVALEKSKSKPNQNNEYRLCLTEHGMKPESLFVSYN